jgi:hypothetical protein
MERERETHHHSSASAISEGTFFSSCSVFLVVTMCSSFAGERIAPCSAGMAASTAIFIEKKGRRSELALYVLPRAIESLLETLLRRRVLPRLPFWEVALFAVCMGRLMYYKSAPILPYPTTTSTNTYTIATTQPPHQ